MVAWVEGLVSEHSIWRSMAFSAKCHRVSRFGHRHMWSIISYFPQAKQSLVVHWPRCFIWCPTTQRPVMCFVLQILRAGLRRLVVVPRLCWDTGGWGWPGNFSIFLSPHNLFARRSLQCLRIYCWAREIIFLPDRLMGHDSPSIAPADIKLPRFYYF